MEKEHSSLVQRAYLVQEFSIEIPDKEADGILSSESLCLKKTRKTR